MLQYLHHMGLLTTYTPALSPALAGDADWHGSL